MKLILPSLIISNFILLGRELTLRKQWWPRREVLKLISINFIPGQPQCGPGMLTDMLKVTAEAVPLP